jgi:hypothetical protein
LVVTNTGPTLTSGRKFQLFNQPVTGFVSVSLPSGYVWANNLGVDGSIQVNSVISTSPVSLNIQTAGNSLFIQWPADHTGWRLQASTNLLNPDWMDISNATATNQVVIANVISNAGQFFRLVYP